MNIAVPVEMTLTQRMRNARHVMHWFGLLFRLAGVGYLLWGLAAWDAALLVLGLVFVLFPEFLGFVRHRQGKTYGSVYTYTLTDEGIGVTTAISTLRFTWAGVTKVREASDAWIFRIPGAASTTIPKECFTPEQDVEWRAFLADRGLVRT
ncbi:hypothetical protein GCM10009789_61510 [Kribbella sancticallisti]|uniref:YcxB-like C-terminal domain-containing protein n=1 Tax=Kribbella sancticallisti TaxID=460087 RepID=A0ABN2E7Y4_9ACTN